MLTLDWQNNQNWQRVVCRPALPKDTPDVMELTSTIWEGQDYVPKVWQEWLADSHGLLAVAEYGGRVVGLIKLSRMNTDEWWLEGLRVHPQYEGRRIASQLHDYIMDIWQRNFRGALRLATASHRLAVHHLCERTGFQKLAELTSFAATTKTPGNDHLAENGFTTLEMEDIPKALEFLHADLLFQMNGAMMDLGWQWVKPSQKYLQEAIERQHAWWWRHQGLLLVTEDRNDQGELLPIIQLAACPMETLKDFLLEYRWLAGRLGYNKAGWVASLNPELQPYLEQAGFKRDWELSIFLYERKP